MKLSFNKKTLDNVTVVMIALDGLQNYFNKIEEKSGQNKNSYQTIPVEPKLGAKKFDAEL